MCNLAAEVLMDSLANPKKLEILSEIKLIYKYDVH